MHVYNESQEDLDAMIRKQIAGSVDKLRKAMTKKNPQVKQALDDAGIKLRNMTDRMQYADNFYELYRQILLSKQPRLVEIALFDIKDLFGRDLINGNTVVREDNRDVRIIVGLVESVLQCKDEREDTVQINMIQALRSLLTSTLYHINGEKLTAVLSELLNIYSVSKTPAVTQAAKDACVDIVRITFQKLEFFGTLSEEENALYLKRKGRIYDYENDSPVKRIQQDETAKGSQAEHFVQEFMKRTLTAIVDEVVVYAARCEIAGSSADVPLRLVPSAGDTNSPKYKQPVLVEIENERGIKSGKFGWCIISRQAASTFCKDTRVPVCSKELKYQHLQEMTMAQSSLEHMLHEQDYVQDARDLIDMLSQLSQREPTNQQLLPQYVKCKSLSLFLIYEALQKGQKILFCKKAFESIVKESLIQSMLKNSLSQDKHLFVLTLNLFVKLTEHYRDQLKVDLEQIIENVYFRILDSSHSSFDHKHLTLTAFHHIVAKPRILLELFVNYDCSVGSNNLVERMLENQCKIIQGKYSRPEFQSSLLPSQDLQLRTLSLDNMVHLVLQLRKYCDEMEKEPIQHEASKTQLEDNDPEEMKEFMQQMDKFDQFEKQRQMKLHIQKAVHKFNSKPENGIKHLLAIGYMKERTPKDVARFLREAPNISKDKMGEYFGSEKEFNQAVFAEFVVMIDLPGLSLDDGLRQTLEYFTLPGESQQIDRIMQTFASKYVQDNPASFNSATAAYTLSYLLMMLQTDLHNPQVLDKMKLTDFIRLARGINDGEDLPQEAMQSFYQRIQKQPLALHSKEQARRTLEQVLQTRGDQKKKHDLFVKEAEKGLKRGQQHRKDVVQSEYIYVNSIDYVKPLMEILWSPLFAAFSVVLERYDDPAVVRDCFDGIQNCVKLLGRSDLDQEKDTFIIFLQKFCPLQNLSQLNNKQILAVHAFLELAVTAGNYLRKSWRNVLQVVSRLDQLLSVTKKVKQDADFFFGEQQRQREQFTQEEQVQIERLFTSIDASLIDKVFIMSVQLDGNSILDFIEALCDLSKQEIQQQHRIFLLSKVVEVADCNMERIKIIWAKIWDIIKAHFWDIGTGKNADLAMYAIDQLKQLSCKFMQQPELANYQFQREFLQPFEQIFQHNLETASYKIPIREYILSCMSMLANICCNSLKSGWKIIMSIVLAALQEDNPNLIRLCVQITDKMMTVNMEVLMEVHMDIIQSFIRLTKCQDLGIVLKAITHLHTLIKHIAENANKKEYKRILEQIWIPVLSSLSLLYSDPRPEVQSQSVRTLFSLLRDFAGQQSPEFWKMILRGVIRPLFDEIQFAFQASTQSRSNSIKQQDEQIMEQISRERQQRIKIATQQAQETLAQFTQLLESQFTQLQPCFADLLDVYISLVVQNQDAISRICMEQLIALVSSIGESLTKEDWEILLGQVSHLLTSCSPNQLLEVKNLDQDFSRPLEDILNQDDIMFKKFGVRLNGGESIFKTNIQNSGVKILLLCAQSHLNKLNDQTISEMNKLFNDAYQKALDFNQRLYMRYFLWKICGYRGNEQVMPGFHELEQMSVSGIISVFYHNQAKEQDPEAQKKLFLDFLDFSESIIQRCLKAQRSFVAISSLELQNVANLKQQLRQIQLEDAQQVMLAYMLILKDTVLPQISRIPFQQILPHLKRLSSWLTDLCKISISNPTIGLQCAYYQEYNESIFELLQNYLNQAIESSMKFHKLE